MKKLQMSVLMASMVICSAAQASKFPKPDTNGKYVVELNQDDVKKIVKSSEHCGQLGLAYNLAIDDYGLDRMKVAPMYLPQQNKCTLFNFEGSMIEDATTKEMSDGEMLEMIANASAKFKRYFGGEYTLLLSNIFKSKNDFFKRGIEAPKIYEEVDMGIEVSYFHSIIDLRTDKKGSDLSLSSSALFTIDADGKILSMKVSSDL